MGRIVMSCGLFLHVHWLVQTFGRGVLCNWLVCLAVWQATAANTLGGKAIAVWLPISAFVAMGLEVRVRCSIQHICVVEQMLPWI